MSSEVEIVLEKLVHKEMILDGCAERSCDQCCDNGDCLTQDARIALSRLKSGEVVVVETKKLSTMLRVGCPPSKAHVTPTQLDCHPGGCWQCKLAYLQGDGVR